MTDILSFLIAQWRDIGLYLLIGGVVAGFVGSVEGVSWWQVALCLILWPIALAMIVGAMIRGGLL